MYVHFLICDANLYQKWKSEQEQSNVTSRPAFKTSPALERMRTRGTKEDRFSKKRLAWFCKWGRLFGRPPDKTGLRQRGSETFQAANPPEGWCNGVLFFEHLNWSRPKTRVHLSSLCTFWHNCSSVNLVPFSHSSLGTQPDLSTRVRPCTRSLWSETHLEPE